MEYDFSVDDVKTLRERARVSIQFPAHLEDGWSRSPVDPMKLLKTFDSLDIRDGFVLRGYVFRDGANGNGIVWAMPANSEFPFPEDCEELNDRFLSPPKPTEAIDDFMAVINGDGSPWSYVSASIFAREAHEYGALWHGCDWTDHEIIGGEIVHPVGPPHQDLRKKRD